ncbi:hypothetical protein BDR26DRAFT_855220, partial [Obelidium mucronatum]
MPGQNATSNPETDIENLFSHIDSFLHRKKEVALARHCGHSLAGDANALDEASALISDMKKLLDEESRLFSSHMDRDASRTAESAARSVENTIWPHWTSPRESEIKPLGLTANSQRPRAEIHDDSDMIYSDGEVERGGMAGASDSLLFGNDRPLEDYASNNSFLHFGHPMKNSHEFSDIDPFSPHQKANVSTPFSIKSAFKLQSNDESGWSPVGRPAMIDFTKEFPPSAPLAPNLNTAQNPFSPQTDSQVPSGIGNILDETFDISGHDFSPTNSGASSPSSTSSVISNVSFKPDDFILRDSQNMSGFHQTNDNTPSTPTTQLRIAGGKKAISTPKSALYKSSHPMGVFGSDLYENIRSGGSPMLLGKSSETNTPGLANDDEFAKTPMSKYFAEKSFQMGGKLGEYVDAGERPYFQTPKKDRYGKVVDMMPETPPMEGRQGLSKNLRTKGGHGQTAKAVGKHVGSGVVAKKPLYIRSPALGKARVTVKWDGGQLRRDVVKKQQEGNQQKVQYKTRRVPTPVSRKPLYQPPPPRNRDPVVSKIPAKGSTELKRSKAALGSRADHYATRTLTKVNSKLNIKISASEPSSSVIKPSTEHKLFVPHISGTRHILQELVLPSTNGGSVLVKATSRKSIYIPPPPLSSVKPKSKSNLPTQKTYIRLHNPNHKASPFYITSTGGNGGTRDGKPCSFYSSFRFETMKGVVSAGGVLDVEVGSTGVLRGVYVQSFRVFANRGSVPFTLRTVI